MTWSSCRTSGERREDIKSMYRASLRTNLPLHYEPIRPRSLVYGDLGQATKQELIAELGPRFDGSILKVLYAVQEELYL